MIVQEDVPYTKEEVKAMVKTIHDLRKKVSQLGWHPASEPPKEDGEYVVFCYGSDLPFMARYSEYINEWNRQNVKCWCYKPKDE
jgi:hypothetical protein